MPQRVVEVFQPVDVYESDTDRALTAVLQREELFFIRQPVLQPGQRIMVAFLCKFFRQQALLQLTTQENLLRADAQEKKTQIASLTASMEEVEARKKTLQEDLEANETRRVQTEQQKTQCAKALEQANDGVQSATN